jgi:uncharacterized membrane protein
MKIHRWWLALVAVLLMPWIGPHIDSYVPIGWVVFRGGGEKADLGFWIVAGVLLCLAYVAWVVLLSVIAAWASHRRSAAMRRRSK